MAKRSSRNPAKFGKGEPEGVIAPETADHAAGSPDNRYNFLGFRLVLGQA